MTDLLKIKNYLKDGSFQMLGDMFIDFQKDGNITDFSVMSKNIHDQLDKVYKCKNPKQIFDMMDKGDLGIIGYESGMELDLLEDVFPTYNKDVLMLLVNTLMDRE